MRLEKVDLNLFVVLDALYKEQSVTKVALLLNLTQPAVSNALSRLRKLFDDQLFVRTPEGMLPTPVADNVIADVRKALALLGRSILSNTRFHPAQSEKLFRLGMNDLAESLLLPKLRLRIKQEAPEITVQSYYIDRTMATEDLKSGGLDLLLDVPAVNAKEFNHVPLAQLPYVVAMRKKHPLSKLDLTLEGFLDSEHLHVSSRRKGRGQMDIALHALGQRRNIKMRVQSYLVAIEIASQTDLLWTAPKVLAEKSGLHTSAVPFNVEPLSWNLYWHKNADLDPASQWIRQLLMEVVSEVLGQP
ncbi:LysR family transcriptional regulator [Aestuariicella hydrocarbonica]|uniref:LysR family transcriptional regulator n=1 Tax=Pseudomaricurvus hydrocarbonicus TaxID=1470433 RepID=A0A9E5MND3_9GAMM|nr:LysR family transcriptional regulator [Aestuariicella hydrocarbonica]NHO67431.1 LysR family transcriptional regulator [Aestuariicella hydrocarbonica]